MSFRYFSAFSGIGGFDKGIQLAYPDAECVGFSEVDRYAIKVYEKHFPNRTNYGDIGKIDAKFLPDFDIFCGGFPCQDLSIAGKRAGLQGDRSGLFFEIIRIIREKQPQLVFLENVKGLFSSNGGWDFAIVLTELDDAGYDVEWQCLNSKDFRVPQNRERVFIIGHSRTKPGQKVFPLRQDDGVHRETAGKEVAEAIVNCLDANYHKGADTYGRRSLIQLGCLGEDSEASRVYSADGIAKTIKNGGGGGVKTGLYEVSGNASPLRWRRTELGKENRRKSKEETGIDYTPFNDGNRELVPAEDGIVNCVTNAIGKDALIGVVSKPDVELLFNKNPSGHGQSGNVYGVDGVAPTLCSNASNGAKSGLFKVDGQQPSEIELLFNKNPSGHGQGGNVYGTNGVAPSLCAGGDNPNRDRDIGYNNGYYVVDSPDETSVQTELDYPKKNVRIPEQDVGSALTAFSDRTDALTVNQQIRRLTPMECERLQGYPDLWTAVGSDGEPLSDTQRYKMLGNAVTVNVIEAIVRQMKWNSMK